MSLPARRLGPRPLPLHLANGMTTLTSSQAALPLLKRGSPPWRPAFETRGRALQNDLAAVPFEGFEDAVERELRRRADRFLAGIEIYRRHAYRREVVDPPTIWTEGSSRLLDYGPPDGAPLLVVPSLINRAYILDLGIDNSLLRHLAAAGIRPLLVDWGRPGAVERRFTLTDYIAGRLERAAAAAHALAGAPMAVMGYCMGGLLALALAQRQPKLVRALALLATPWHFHAENPGQAKLLGAMAEPLAAAFAGLGEIPVDVLQALFAAVDPLLALRKFSAFAELAPDSAAARDFVALEDWLNDGIPLVMPVAQECLVGWYADDRPGRGIWQVAGTPVLPALVDVPAIVVLPGQDKLVPPASAAALVAALPGAQRLAVPLGHIGMVASRKAPPLVWHPLAAWLQRH
jgi:polyhydroxyalkanoate synthase